MFTLYEFRFPSNLIDSSERAKHRIEAIKTIREFTGLGLAESRDIINDRTSLACLRPLPEALLCRLGALEVTFETTCNMDPRCLPETCLILMAPVSTAYEPTVVSNRDKAIEVTRDWVIEALQAGQYDEAIERLDIVRQIRNRKAS